MARFVTITLVLLLTFAASTSAATIHARVVTDKSMYLPGEAVNWTIYAWVHPDDGTDGIAMVAVNLLDSTGETLNPADREEVFFPGSGIFQLQGTDFGFAQGFTLHIFGTVHPHTGELLDILAANTSMHSHVSNVGEDDGLAPLPLFAQGSYTATRFGSHTLELSFNGANYWDSPTATQAPIFEEMVTEHANFDVPIPEPATLLLLGTGLLGFAGVFRRLRLPS